MIYPKSKIIFVHIPKTGGSTLEYHLGQVEEPEIFEKYRNDKRHMNFLNHLYKQNQLEDKNRRWSIHRQVDKYINHLGDDYDKYYSFSILRNPFALIKSLYSMNKEYSNKRGETFPEWEPYVLCESKKNIIKESIFIDQKRFVCDNKDNILVKELFSFEDYQNVVKKLGRKFNFKPDFKVKLWSTKPEHDYTPEMIYKVLERYHDSYELWKKVNLHWGKKKTPYVGKKKDSSSITG
jgi:hypothetical protein